MQRKDLLPISFVTLLALALYFPVFYSEYLYTDEAVQLWKYKPGSDFQMFLPQGRYVTDQLFRFLFSRANTVADVTWIRIFSLVGWLLCIPVWFCILKKIVVKEKLPEWLPFMCTLYLVCTPTFTISVGWASCLELFLANTSGLLAGYFFYSALLSHHRILYSFLAVMFGLLSLFTYQNGFGCFLLPFLLYMLGNPGKWKKLLSGVAGYILISGIYLMTFRYQLHYLDIPQLDRTDVQFNFVGKLKFFFTRPLASAFHFNYLVNETSRAGVAVSMLLLIVALLFYYLRLMALAITQRFAQVVLLILVWILIYLPSLVVKENYSSNRTLLALAMSIFIFVIWLLLQHVSNSRKLRIILIGVGVLLASNAFYNFQFQFLQPVKDEYAILRPEVLKYVTPGTDTFVVIQPTEDFYERKYGIARSWDEFGVPSIFFGWVPEFFIRQMAIEKTGDRDAAEKLVIQAGIGKQALPAEAVTPGPGKAIIDGGKILNTNSEYRFPTKTQRPQRE